MKSKISFAILTFNEEKNIKNALNSLTSLSIENIYVYDGGSSDNTEQIVREHGIDFFLYKNTSIERRRFEAIKKSDSEYICFLDADQSLPENNVIVATKQSVIS